MFGQYGYTPYQNYQNYGYTPLYVPQYSQTQTQQNQPQQPQPQVQNTVTNTNKIYVSGIDDVKSRFLSPNSDVLFIDNDKPILYQKVVDSKGQFEIKIFDITLHNEQQEEKKSDTIDLSGYVLKTDLEPLQSEIKALNDKIQKINIQKQINDIKTIDIKSSKTTNTQEG